MIDKELSESCGAVVGAASSDLQAEWQTRVRMLDDERVRQASTSIANTVVLEWLVYKVATLNERTTAAFYCRSVVCGVPTLFCRCLNVFRLLETLFKSLRMSAS